MSHSFINIIAELPRENEQATIDALDALGNPLKEPLAKIIRDINRFHFFSVTVVPSDEETPPYLVFEMSVDGDEKSLLQNLAGKAAAHFEPVFRLAKDYKDSGGLADYFLSHTVKSGFGYFDTPGVGHVGTPGITVDRILKEAELNRAVRVIFNNTPRNGDALDTLERVRDELRKNKEHEWAFTPESALLLNDEKPGNLVLNILKKWPVFIATFLWPFFLIAFVLSALMIIPDVEKEDIWLMTALLKTTAMTVMIGVGLSLAFVVFAYAQLRKLEGSDIADDTPPNHKILTEIRKREDHAYQNHLAGVSIIKTGWVRKLMLRLIFWLVYTAVTTFYRPGFLGSIGTIHFARWLVVPNTNRLLFFSNFGGSWESYLEDFITKSNIGLTGVWSNTIGFPKTTNLLFDGASDGDRFKRWARRQQNPTWCWYTAYPDLTTARIRTNAAIRQGIAGISTETEARDWLSLFGSTVLPREEMQHDNVQGILFGGFGPLPHAACLMLRLPDNVKDAKSWLADISTRITFGDYKPGDEDAAICALSATGLQKLGLNEDDMATFPHAFAQGMAARARIIGDRGTSAPDQWEWGASDKTVDAALFLYTPDAASLDKLVQAEIDLLMKCGGDVVRKIPLKDLPPKGTPFKEPFGFIDGVSQPIMRGTGKHRPGMRNQHIVEHGEFIMGYPDGLGTYPQTPYVPAIADTANDLYAVPDMWGKQRPDFSNSLATCARDLGRDGSFMVIRQLEQDVDGFKTYTEKAAKQLNEGVCPLNVNARWVAAKMVGRWDDGSSLIRNQYVPATDQNPTARPDNDFLFGKEDPQGLRCPFGSHVRRSNPRESFDPGSEAQLKITNRHRILRAGRAYEENGKNGLMFVCLNADIERQFEFIQQTWSIATTFHGLDSETDPFINDMGDSSRYTIPMQDGARTITGLKSFVTTKGGEYFFVPGVQTLRFLSRAG
jgi:Dyp-type peroxidase family